jgi:Na+-translocating ferredoxin:NAD+ oxidoreductase RNF subunit RnfB
VDSKWIPVVIEELCSGCNLCVAACGPACLELDATVAVLARPNVCGSDEHCIGVCPEDAIHMAWVLMEGDRTIGQWRPSTEPEVKLVNKMQRGLNEKTASVPNFLSQSRGSGQKLSTD